MRTHDEVKDVLAGLDLLAGLRDRELRRLARVAKVRDHPEAGVLLAEDGVRGAVLVVVSGRVAILRRDEVIAEAGAGEVVGHFAALLGVPARTATVRALERTTTVAFSSVTFLALLEEHPGLALRVMRGLCARLAAGSVS